MIIYGIDAVMLYILYKKSTSSSIFFSRHFSVSVHVRAAVVLAPPQMLSLVKTPSSEAIIVQTLTNL